MGRQSSIFPTDSSASTTSPCEMLSSLIPVFLQRHISRDAFSQQNPTSSRLILLIVRSSRGRSSTSGRLDLAVLDQHFQKAAWTNPHPCFSCLRWISTRNGRLNLTSE